MSGEAEHVRVPMMPNSHRPYRSTMKNSIPHKSALTATRMQKKGTTAGSNSIGPNEKVMGNNCVKMAIAPRVVLFAKMRDETHVEVVRLI